MEKCPLIWSVTIPIGIRIRNGELEVCVCVCGTHRWNFNSSLARVPTYYANKIEYANEQNTLKIGTPFGREPGTGFLKWFYFIFFALICNCTCGLFDSDAITAYPMWSESLVYT